jgi:NADPH:quinone reductase-like Zn-dependent oxidoreductase
MRSVVIHRPGGYDRLQIQSGPDPVARPGEVVVRTHAVGVNYADCLVRWGVYASARQMVGWPVTPGFEFAGEVAEAPTSDRFAPGDPVFGVRLFGSYSSHVLVPEDHVFPIPPTWSMEEAAAFPVAYLTAHHALYVASRIRQEMTVLVHSAAGGVGSALVRLAALAGARVVGVVGAPHKVEIAHALGADATIDKSTQPLWATAERLAPSGYDIILDANGPETLKASYEHLAPLGTLVVYGFHTLLPRSRADARGRLSKLRLLPGWLRTPRFSPLRMTRENRTVAAFNLSFVGDRTDLLREAMEGLTRWIDAGALAPPEVTCFPFERVAEAHRALESGRTTGKLVLVL